MLDESISWYTVLYLNLFSHLIKWLEIQDIESILLDSVYNWRLMSIKQSEYCIGGEISHFPLLIGQGWLKTRNNQKFTQDIARLFVITMSHIQEFHNSTGLMTPSRARNVCSIVNSSILHYNRHILTSLYWLLIHLYYNHRTMSCFLYHLFLR